MGRGKTEKQSEELRDIQVQQLWYQRMGCADYAIKMFHRSPCVADFETIRLPAHSPTNWMKPASFEKIKSYFYSPLFYMQKLCCHGGSRQEIAVEEGNAMAHYLLGKADDGQNDGIMCIAHLTKAIVLRGRLHRSSAACRGSDEDAAGSKRLWKTWTWPSPDDENAILLRGKIKEATGADQSRSRLSSYNGTESVQRTGIPLLGTVVHRPEKADRSHRFV